MLPVLTTEYLSHPTAPSHPLIQATVMFYFLIVASLFPPQSMLHVPDNVILLKHKHESVTCRLKTLKCFSASRQEQMSKWNYKALHNQGPATYPLQLHLSPYLALGLLCSNMVNMGVVPPEYLASGPLHEFFLPDTYCLLPPP